MTDLDALFRAILDHPDDDTLRLVYADALEDVGQSRRAAFVRAEIDVSPLPEYDPRHVRYLHHERADLIDWTWTRELPNLPAGLRWAVYPFRRGFPAAIRADNGAAFADGAEALFAIAPIDSLEFGGIRPSDPHLLSQCPWISRISRLSLPAGLGQQLARRLLHHSHNWTRLTELFIGPGLSTPATAREVVHSRVFGQLTAFAYRDERRGGALVAELTQLADPPPLKTLDLASSRITADWLSGLLSAPVLSAVEEFDLSDNNLGPEGVHVLASASLPALRSLRLIRTRPEEVGMRWLAQSRVLAELQALNMSGNNLGPAAAVELAGTPGITNLRTLELADNRMGDDGAAAIAYSSHIGNLVLLDLSGNGIEDAGALALAQSPGLDGLIHLDLSANVISPTAVESLNQRFGERVAL